MARLRTRTDGITVTRTSSETGSLKEATQTYTAYPTQPNEMYTPLERFGDPVVVEVVPEPTPPALITLIVSDASHTHLTINPALDPEPELVTLVVADASHTHLTVEPSPVPEAEELFTLTMGVSTDDPITNYGFSYYDEGVTGYPGAPFGAVNPPTVATHTIIYFAFGPNMDGFIFYIWLTTSDNLAPPSDVFDTIQFTDDNDVTWEFERANADNPTGSDFTFGDGDVREWKWTVPASALPTVTPDQDYILSGLTP